MCLLIWKPFKEDQNSTKVKVSSLDKYKSPDSVRLESGLSFYLKSKNYFTTNLYTVF